MTGVHKVLDDARAHRRRRQRASATAPPSRPTSCSRARCGHLGFITTEGYEFLLEIARQSVPDGYGNSYFWVKPDRIVPADRVRDRRRAAGRHRRARSGRSTRTSAVAAARFFRDAGIDTIGVCFLHSYVDDAHERAMREVLAREHPDAVVSISSEVLREYREYERAVTTPGRRGGQARHPPLRRQHRDGRPATPARRPGRSVLRDEVQRRRAVAPTRSSTSRSRPCCPGPAAGALGAAVVAEAAGLPAGASPATAAAPRPTSPSSSTGSRP